MGDAKAGGVEYQIRVWRERVREGPVFVGLTVRTGKPRQRILARI